MSELDTLVRNLRILLKADLIIAELAMRRLATRSVLFVFAGLIAAFAVGMFAFAGFLMLEEAYGTKAAAAICGGVGLVVALILMLVASGIKPGREDEVAVQVHEAALQAVSVELQVVGGQAQRLAAFVRAPFSAGVPSIAMAIFGYLLRLLRGRGGGGASSG